MIFNDDSNIPLKWYLLASEDGIDWEVIEYRDSTISSLLGFKIFYNVVYPMNISYSLQGDASPDDVDTTFYFRDNSFNSVKAHSTNRDVPQFKCFRFVFTGGASTTEIGLSEIRLIAGIESDNDLLIVEADSIVGYSPSGTRPYRLSINNHKNWIDRYLSLIHI